MFYIVKHYVHLLHLDIQLCLTFSGYDACESGEDCRCFWVESEVKTFDQAYHACANAGGALVWIDSLATQERFKDIFKTSIHEKK
jgi:hypothetical protein